MAFVLITLTCIADPEPGGVGLVEDRSAEGWRVGRSIFRPTAVLSQTLHRCALSPVQAALAIPATSRPSFSMARSMVGVHSMPQLMRM